ncbi:MAG: type restriction enzyme subunit [Thermoleophilaceae bacterium]|jgi:type I restriction enzyme R subunit|nr:type restriction enzyme subunit [Thermoleophilaceae bacterium]
MSSSLKLGEDALVEQPALAWLEELGWEHAPGHKLAPSAPASERGDYREVLLVRRLRNAIAHLNPHLPDEAVDAVITDVRESTSVVLIDDHYAFHEFLVLGVPVTWTDSSGEEQSGRAKLVDFGDPTNNEFLAVNQFRVEQGSGPTEKKRRPDILLFVNGIPLGQIEAKAPGDKGGQAVINQVAGYWQDIPYLYRFIEVIAVTDRREARVGTVTTPAEHFAEWKTMDPQPGEKKQTGLKVMLQGVYTPARFLDLIANYVMFETDGAKTWKVMAKYHQVQAVEKALEATWAAMNGDGRAGVIWHTQGSGKSYLMAFYTSKLRKDPRFESPTVVALTDREQLDDQLYKTFRRQKHLAAAVKRAERIEPPKGPTEGRKEESLHELLRRPPGDIVFTTIQKFDPGRERSQMPVLSERANIVVMADEAHRTQYGDLARNVTRSLPNAIRIGFTGTPIEAGDRNTRLTFGDYVSVYRISDAEADGAVVPIFYESRVVPLDVKDEELLREAEEVLSEEDEGAARKLQTAWARLEKLVGTDERLDVVAKDIAEHYTERCKVQEGKAMVVGYSQRICVDLVKRLKAHLGEDAVTAVISATATDDPEISAFRRTRHQREELEELYKQPDSALRIVVVRDMWLTGFDAPVMHTLYVDKPMKDHGLLQAIARVNRVFRDKPGGLVVDYIGIGEDLRASLTAYAKQDVDDVAVPLAVAVKHMREKHEVVAAMLHGVEYAGWETKPATEVTELIEEASDLLLEDQDSTTEFLRQYTLFSRWFALAGTTSEAVEVATDAEFFGAVAREVRAYAAPTDQASPEAEQVVKQFISTGLAAGEVVDVLKLAGKERPEVSVLSDEFLDEVTKKVSERPNLAVNLIKRLLDEEVRVRLRSNHLQAKLFSDRIDELLQAYDNRTITSAEIVARLVEIAKQLREARHRHEELGLTEEEAAFYDALAGNPENWTADPKLVTIARELVQGIRSDLTVDWTSDESTEAAVRKRIKRLLRRHRRDLPDPPASGVDGGGGRPLDIYTDLILEQALTLYRRWPEVEIDAW